MLYYQLLLAFALQAPRFHYLHCDGQEAEQILQLQSVLNLVKNAFRDFSWHFITLINNQILKLIKTISYVIIIIYSM